MTLTEILYPRIKPYHHGFLHVDAGHRVYFEESGNPDGKPAVYLHGGPGAGTEPRMRRLFDPKKYRIVLFDQRGSGRSTPRGSLVNNTTWHLVKDMEALRGRLQIERWLVAGGSWGSTLALAYAQKHPRRVTELVLRGIFLGRKSDIAYFYQDPSGTAALFPDRWAAYVAPIPPAERRDMVRAYFRRLSSANRKTAERAARAWSIWEGATSYLLASRAEIASAGRSGFASMLAKIECHYFVHRCFLRERQLLDDIGVVRQIPAVIVQGRYDVICPMRGAWDLHRAWPRAQLRIVDAAGHSAFEPGTARELVRALSGFATKR